MTAIEHFFGNSSSVEISLEDNDFEAEVFVRCDDPEDTGYTVVRYLVNNGFGYGSSYKVGNDDPNEFSDKTRIYQIDKPALFDGCLLWRTVVHYRLITPAYSSGSSSGSDPDQPDDPLDLRPSLTTHSMTRQVPIVAAKYLGGFTGTVTALQGLNEGDTVAICNSARITLNPLPTKDASTRIAKVTRNLASVIVDDDNFPMDWVNTEDITLTDNRRTEIVAKAGQMKFLRWNTRPKFEEGLDFVEVSLEVEIKKEGWIRFFLDEGLAAKAATGDPDGRGGTVPAQPVGQPNVRGLTDINGIDLDQPIPFDGAGNPYSALELISPQYPLIYSAWQPYDETDAKQIPFLVPLVKEEE